MIYQTDIDVDVKSDFVPAEVLPGSVRASTYKDGKLTPHPCGVYLQNVPVDPVTNLAAAPYETAELLGAFKLDLLHLTIYDAVADRAELKRFISTPPDWQLLKIPSVVKQLFQLSKHADLIARVFPTSVEEVADCLALIRPQKSYLTEPYLKDKARVRRVLYTREPGDDEGSGYGFKKAHAIAYAMVIVVQLHLIKLSRWPIVR